MDEVIMMKYAGAVNKDHFGRLMTIEQTKKVIEDELKERYPHGYVISKWTEEQKGFEVFLQVEFEVKQV